MRTCGPHSHPLLRFFVKNWALLVRSYFWSLLARAFPVPGRVFEGFGRALGRRATAAGETFGPDLWLTPVNITRYWEFPFVWSQLRKPPNSCLDVASPRLFSLFVAARFSATNIRILNPDIRDAIESERAARFMNAHRITVDPRTIESMDEENDQFDNVWSISVVEHIPDNGDVEAVRVMYNALAPGGRLVITVPVDRVASIEYRPIDTYKLGLTPGPEGYFFQRWYDLESVHARLIDPLCLARQTSLAWFGETHRGRFAAYIQDWLRRGRAATVADPFEIGRHYREFPSWEKMDGQGVCGIAVTKPGRERT